jgi:hypothetical protein
MGFVLPASPHQPPPPYSQTKSSPKSSTRNSRPKAHACGLTPTDTDPKTQALTFALRLTSSPPVRNQRPRSNPRHRPLPGLLSSSPIRRQRTQRQNQTHGIASVLSTEEWVPKQEAPDCTALGSILVINPTFVPPKRPSHRASNQTTTLSRATAPATEVTVPVSAPHHTCQPAIRHPPAQTGVRSDSIAADELPRR